MTDLIKYIILLILLILTSILTTIFILRHKYQKKLEDFQDSVLKKQRDEVQNIYQTMRAWRHDYHNHIQSIKALLSMGKNEQLSEYLDNLESDLDSIDIAIRTGNVGLDAILSSKVSIARKKKIDVNCTAKVPDQLKITDVHLCAIVGNLMDNAIEACEKIENSEKRFIRIYIGLFKSQLYISVSNSTNQKKRKKPKKTKKSGKEKANIKSGKVRKTGKPKIGKVEEKRQEKKREKE